MISNTKQLNIYQYMYISMSNINRNEVMTWKNVFWNNFSNLSFFNNHCNYMDFIIKLITRI